MASSNGRSRWYHQGFSNGWFRIFFLSKTSQKEICKFSYRVKRIFLNLYMILNSQSHILNKLILSLSIDRRFYFDNFGVFYKDTLVYITTNPDRDVVKHKVDDLFSGPRHLPNTRIPNQHTGGPVIGVHVGHYVWIFKGYADMQSMNYHESHRVKIKSSLWSLKRDVWINGPEIPEGLIKDSPCATAINDTFAIIVNINSYKDSIPVLAYDFSKGDWHLMANPPMQILDLSCTCAAMYEKTNRQ